VRIIIIVVTFSRNGLRDYGIDLNQRELDDVFMMFDRDRNGFVDVDEFFIGIKGDLNDRRKKLIRMAFDTLDTDRSGFITVDEMNEKYDVSCNPEVQQGKKTPDEAMQEFMTQWDRLDGDGMVSVEEFEDYYKGVSSSIDGDDYFELMIRNAWRIAGGTGACANTANKRVLVTNKDGSQRVVTVNNELGMKGGDVDAVRNRLAQQGISGGAIELHGGADTTEKPKKSRTSRQSGAAPVYERHQAAEKLSSAFRGHKARKEVEYKKRATDNARQQEMEYEEEINREKSRKIYRPKGKSYSGF
jgi:Ca2+-binding EF-hand superfamily protein